MYDFIRGRLEFIEGNQLTLEVQGIGFRITIPARYQLALPNIGDELFLYTAFVIREFSQTLYGFLERNERNLFELLIDLSGIGPKTALNILGQMSPEVLSHAVSTRDMQTLAKVPGIGKKTAERLILDLKDKLSAYSSKSFSCNKIQDALSALLNLGYSQKKAEMAVNRAAQSLPQDCQIQDLIKKALSLTPV